MKENKIFNQDFSLIDRPRDRAFLVLFMTVYLVLFLNIYKPYNVEYWAASGDELVFTLSAFGIIGGLGIAFSQFVLRRLFKMERFTLKQFLLWVSFEFVVITLIFTIIFNNVTGLASFFHEFYFNVKLTILSAIIPYTTALLILSLIKNKREVKKLQVQRNKVVLTNEMLKLPDDKGNIKFTFPVKDLLYLESTDNYVLIHYIAGDQLKQEILRNSLKKLEEILVGFPLKRCHRSYMVNLDNLTMVKKTGQKMTLVLPNVPELIPVSKTYQNSFKEYLEIDN
jgi:hypothetical protein